MEARDSSSSSASATAAGRGDDGQLEEDAAACGLARDAVLLFQSGRFAECVEVLHQILQKKQDDPKVLHNIAVAKYFHDGCSDPKKLLDSLNKIKKRSENFTDLSGEQIEVAGHSGNNIASGCKGAGDIKSASILYADSFDTSIVTLNIATALYHLHDYAHALLVLEPLFQRLHPLDETIALQVCLLLIDIALASNNASRAADVILHIEKTFGVGYMSNQGDTSNISQQETLSQTLKATSTPSVLTVPDSSSDFCVNANSSENALDGTLSEDAIEYENLLSTLHSGDQSLTRSNVNEIPRTTEQPAHATDLKLKIHLYKVQLLLLTRNLKAAKREIKLIMNVARGRDSSAALLLKSELEYARGNQRKAIKLLMTSSNRTEPGAMNMFSNNLGCIYHRLQKHHTSIVLFSRALGRSPLRVEKTLKNPVFPMDRSILVLYNCGLQYLTCGKPLVAARCFHEVSRIFYSRPLLWLRFAECCLLALEKGQLKQNVSSSFSGQEQVKLHVVGLGKWRQLAVDTNQRDEDAYSTSQSNDDDELISLPFARQCLLNALFLLDRSGQKYPSVNYLVPASEIDCDPTLTSGLRNVNHRSTQASEVKVSSTTSSSASASANGDSRESKGSAASNATIQSSVSAYEEICRKENNMIRQAALADLAYVELNLRNHLRALSAAKALQQLPDCSKVYMFLGCVYAAEALCYLNRLEEAVEHLYVYISDGNSLDLPYNEDDRHKWISEKLDYAEENNGPVADKSTTSDEIKGGMFLRSEEARGILYVNLALVFAMQGNLEKAKVFISQALSALPSNPKALIAAVYLDLRLGKTSDALIKLKECTRSRFLSNGMTLNSSR